MNPGQVEIYDGIVGDIKGIGDVSQKPAGSGRDVSRDVTGSEEDYHGKDDNDAEGVIQAVQAEMFRASYMGRRQGSRQKQAAPPETMPDPSRFAQAEQEQTAEAV